MEARLNDVGRKTRDVKGNKRTGVGRRSTTFSSGATYRCKSIGTLCKTSSDKCLS